MAGRKCSICSHQESARITKAICDGGSKRTIADRFGVTPAAVQRHRSGCLHMAIRSKTDETARAERSRESVGDSVRFENATNPISKPADLLERLGSLFRLGDLLEEAYQRRDVDAVVKLAREYRAAAESYARVAGWLVDGGVQVNVDQRRQGLVLLGGMSEDELRTQIARLTAAGSADVIVDAVSAPIEVESRSLGP